LETGNDPQDPRSTATGEPQRLADSLSDGALRSLEERLDRASEAAERLIADAASRVVRKPPAAGWQQPDPADADGGETRRGEPSGRTGERRGSPADPRASSEIELLLGVLSSIKDRIPPDLQRRLGEALREVLLALRALIDWYLERTERGRTAPTEVQDIPIL